MAEQSLQQGAELIERPLVEDKLQQASVKKEGGEQPPALAFGGERTVGTPACESVVRGIEPIDALPDHRQPDDDVHAQ